MAVDIDRLQIQVEADSQEAANGIQKLADTLENLKKMTKGIGLGSVSTQMKGIAEAAEKLAGSKSASGKIQSLANALGAMNRVPSLAAVSRQLASLGEGMQALSSANFSSTKIQAVGGMLTGLASVPKLTGMTSVSKQLTSLAGGLTALSAAPVDQSKIQSIVSAMGSLATIGKASGLNSALNALKKLPTISAELNNMNLGTFAAQMKEVAAAIRPLANEMQKVSNGFAAFPIRIQKIIAGNAGLAASNNRVAKSFNLFGSSIFSTLSRITLFGYSLRRVYGWMKSWVTESSAYVENLNLFTITMGDATDEALKFADAAHEALGIDPSQFIRNWGLFQNTLTGFGIVADKAHLMSKNLTQLAYDMASFFDTDVSTAMEKLQSAMTGQVRPLREFGYAIDQATLQQVAYAHNIDLSVAKMSQAQKAQLRYLTIMEHSKNVMGDMGRTIMTPANAMRVFGEQVTQLTRALGNLLIPALSKVLPYVQAFVEVLTEAIQRAAEFLGFVLPNIDYSGLDGATGGFDDMEEGIEGAEEAAKELKRTLLGFDELNVLPATKSAEMDQLENDLKLDLPEYDFLKEVKNETKKIKDTIKKFFTDIKNMLEPFVPLLEGIGTAFLLAFGFNWIADAVTKFAKIGAIAGIIGALKTALATAALTFAIAKNPILALGAAFGSLWASFKAFMSGLSPLMKAMISLIALIAEFVTIKNAIYDLTMGNISLGQALMNIIPIAALVGAAMYAMWGPMGLVVAAIVGIVAAFVGFSQAQDELRRRMVEATFFDGQGVAIQDLANHYSNLVAEIGNAYDPIINLGKAISASRSSVDDSIESFDAFIFGLENGLYTVEEVLPKIQEEFELFRDNMQMILDDSYSIVVRALAGSVGDALIAAGENLGEYTSLMAEAKGNLDQELINVTNEFNTLNKSLADGKIDNEKYNESLEAVFERMRNLSLSEVQREISDLNIEMGQLIDIDWGADTAFTEAKDAISSFGSVVDESKQKIIDANKETVAAFEQMRLGVTTEAGRLKMDKAIEEAMTAMENDLAKIDSLAAQFAGQMQGNLIQEVQKQYDAALEEWDTLGFVAQIFKYGGNKANYVSQALSDYRSTIVEPLTNEMRTIFGAALGEDATWATDSINQILKNMFGIDPIENVKGYAPYYVDLAGDIKSEIDNALQKAGFEQSGVSIAENLSTGLIEGLKAQGDPMARYVSSWASDITSTVQNTFGIHSPSTVFRDQIGLNLGLGIAEGLADSMRPVTEEANSLANSISGAFDGMAFNIPATFQIPKIPTVDTSRTARLDPMISSEARAQIVGSISSRAIAADDSRGGFSDGMAEANEDVINALYAIATQIMRTIEEKDTNVYLDRERISRASAEDYERYRKTRGSSFVKRGV